MLKACAVNIIMPGKSNDAEIELKRTSSSRRGRQKDVVYGVLLECSKIAKDEFWRNFYEDLASGKASRGIYISNGVIHSSNKRGGFTYNITDKAPEVIVQELHYLLTTHTSICSRKDMTKKRQIVQEIEDELNEYDRGKWKAIKRKNVRNMLLVDFALSLRHKYGLTWPATLSAYHTIVTAFECKTHSSKDVNYERGKIRSIDDIDISEDKTTIINQRDLTEDEPELKPETNAIYIQSMFEPYLSTWIKSIK